MNCSNCGKTYWKVTEEETEVQTPFEGVTVTVIGKQFECGKCGLLWYPFDLEDSFPNLDEKEKN